MSKRRSDEEKILFDPYVSLSTVQRYFSLNKIDAEDIFVKAQELDEKNGYLKIYDNQLALKQFSNYWAWA